MSYAVRIDGSKKIKLTAFDPADACGVSREQAESETAALISELAEMQELLYAVRSHRVLVILQGRDAGGKDGVIRGVTGKLNPLSCAAVSFGAPTKEELAHDFLWRVHPHVPGAGQICVFNRSHYEDVLAARVRGFVSEAVWRARYEHINAFEKLLTDNNTIVLKFYLNLSKAEQLERLAERERNPLKAWKLSLGDWHDREHWDDYTAAYEDVINRCSSVRAPWFVVSADKKWFRNLTIAEALRDALKPYKQRWRKQLGEVGLVERRAIEAYRQGKGFTLPPVRG